MTEFLGLAIGAGTYTALGPDIARNGTFDADYAGWDIAFNGALSTVGGRLRVTATGGGSAPRAYQILTGLTIGAIYEVSADLYAPATATAQLIVSTSTSTGGQLTGAIVSQAPPNGVGIGKSLQFTATATSHYLVFISSSTTAATYCEIDNVTVKQTNYVYKFENDIYLDPSNNLAFVTENRAIAELAKQRLMFYRGEWFLDTEAGTPWFQEVFVRPTNQVVIEAVIKDAILGTPGIVELLEFEVSINPRTREIAVLTAKAYSVLDQELDVVL